MMYISGAYRCVCVSMCVRAYVCCSLRSAMTINILLVVLSVICRTLHRCEIGPSQIDIKLKAPGLFPNTPLTALRVAMHQSQQMSLDLTYDVLALCVCGILDHFPTPFVGSGRRGQNKRSIPFKS